MDKNTNVNTVINGTSQNDVLHGTNGNDTIYGLGGNDVLIGRDGHDSLYGGSGNDRLYGGNDNDILHGGEGRDVMRGQAGDDIYYVDNIGDTVIEAANEGTDTIYSSVSYTASPNVENLALIGSDRINGTGNNGDNVLAGNSNYNRLNGGRGNDTIYGNRGEDTIDGGEGNDKLYGGADRDNIFGGNGNDLLDGGEGKDVMRGQAGDDVYYVDNVGDTVIEAANEGTDTIYSSVSYTASQNVENLTLTGNDRINGTGNNSDNILVGNDNYNRLNGGRGNDTIYGNGGEDTIDGGEGDDKLYGGADRDNIFGGSGNDLLDGGEGKDVMRGQAGDDVYYVDNVGDTVIEAANEGTDTIYSSVSYTASQNVENLTLTGNDRINGTGNNSDNILVGNDNYNRLNGGRGNDTIYGNGGEDTIDGGDGDDKLYGGADRDNIFGGNGNDLLDGGEGRDVMRGQAGDDVYYVDNVGDTVIEAANEGTDTIYSSVSYTASQNVENLILTGNDRINGTGNNSDNILVGNDNYNRLNGGRGNDTIYGNGGEDTIDGGEGDDRIDGGADRDNIFGGSGNDILRGGEGKDVVNGGDGDDSLVVVGNLTAGSKSTNAAYDAVLGTSLAKMAGTDWNEVVDGEILRGGNGTDTLYVFGTTDLSKAILESIEKIEMPSDVTMTADQLSAVEVSGDKVGTLRVKEESAEKVIVLDDQQLNGIRQLDIGSNVVIEVKNIDSLNGIHIISGEGTLRFTEATELTTDHTITGTVTVINADGTPAAGKAEVLDHIASATDNDTVVTEVKDLDYQDQLSDEVKDSSDTVLVLQGSEGNDFLEGSSSNDALNGANGNDILVGRDGNDIFVIEGAGKKTIIDGGSNQDIDTIVFHNAKEGVNIDLSQFKGNVGSDTTIQIGAGDSGGVAGAAGDKTNLMLIIDTSGSMSGQNMLNAQKAAIELIDKYGQVGNMAIRIIGFDSDGFVQFNGVDSWMNKEDAVKAINTLYAGGGTNYYAALDTAEQAFISNRGNIFHEDGQNFSMFLSDGYPNSPIQMPRQLQWEDFAIKYQIVSHAIGFGGIYSKDALEPIAFDGTKVVNTTDNHDPGQIDPILEGDIDKLSTTVTGTAKTDFIENVGGSNHDDTIVGNSLNNEIRAGAGNDILDGREGNDKLYGQAGDDTYVFSRGYGQDVIIDHQGDNAIHFKGLNAGDVSIQSSQDAAGHESWTIQINGTNDSITIDHQIHGSDVAVNSFVFEDGTLSNTEFAQLNGMGTTNIMGASAENSNLVVHSHNLPADKAELIDISDASGGLLESSNDGVLDSQLNGLLPEPVATGSIGAADTVAYAATEAAVYVDDNVQNTAVI
ncbi:VWA domain-containing protein [Neisseria zalophi]|uniref:VWA domain-containing protein n=1 Tax=Neisseria zalophi TaxID=640030 RepID=A0A5J6PQW4_9NEIS|nr:VWA domain-containing protein [Neisseria zalophi]QEY25128.1 VWA domain-containing protein [Neisseria zalophi]